MNQEVLQITAHELRFAMSLT